MFIRKVKTHTVAGQPGYSFRLVASKRCGSQVRQEVLLHLGTDYPVPRALWPAVTRTALDLLNGQGDLRPGDTEVCAAAEQLVGRLRAAGFVEARATSRFEDARSVGGERLCLHALDELGLPALLQQAGLAPRDAAIATALVAARMLHPASERETLHWLRADSALLELLALDRARPPSLVKLYRTNDRLWQCHERLQRGLFQRERELLDLPGTIVFYDLSNTHYTGRRHESLLRHGRSQQKRHDCPLITLALALDGAGFPRWADILPGNASEPATLEDALGQLAGLGAGAGKPTVVMDAGIASAANLDWLRQQGFHWICVSREAKPDRPDGDPATTVRTKAGYRVRAWPLRAGDDRQENDSAPSAGAGGEARDSAGAGGEVRELRLYVVSDARRRTADRILERQRQRFESDLCKLHAGLSKPRFLKAYDKVQRKVGRLTQQHAKVASQYEVTVTKGEKGRAAAVTFARRPKHAQADAAAGAYVLRTSRTDWDEERILRTYWRLTEVEATFRCLKSELGLRPVYHRLDERIKAHLLISVLAYHAVHLIRTRLKARGLHLSWEKIRHRLRNWVRITSITKDEDGSSRTVRQDTRPKAKAAEIARAAGLPPGPHCQEMRWE